jgi:serine/threonine-protein kinase
VTCSACIHLTDSPLLYCGECGARIAARDRLLGTVLDDRYRIDAKIAAGGFGTIYRAVCLADEREVAIKVLHAQHHADSSVSARFRREAVAMSSLCDPHTVTTYELGEDADGTRFIVMELLRGESLADRFAACGSLHWRSVLAIVRAVCNSLAEAHALGIVHRDLKPANIFLASEPTPDFVKVLDFGIAKIIHGSNMYDGSELTRIGQAIGTLEYMSPEQLVGGDIDGRTDIYTLGVVMYEMITGRRPFNEVTGATGLVTALMTRRPPPPSTVTRGPLPNALDGVLLRCLERDIQDRYTNVGELARAIDQMLASKSDVFTTQQLWLRGAPSASASKPAFVDGDEELTWIDARPPFPADEPVFAANPEALDDTAPSEKLAPESVRPDPTWSGPQFRSDPTWSGPQFRPPTPPKPMMSALAVVDMTPRPLIFDDIVRAQIAPAQIAAVGDQDSPRPWRVAGTGTPFDLEEPTKSATPRSLFAVGSSPVIGPLGSQSVPAPAALVSLPAAPRSDMLRLVAIAMLLTALGLVLGGAIAHFVF